MAANSTFDGLAPLELLAPIVKPVGVPIKELNVFTSAASFNSITLLESDGLK